MSGCTGPVEAPEWRVDRGHQPKLASTLPTSAMSERTTRRDLQSITADGLFYSIMVGIGETYIPAFVLAAGLGEVAAGLITTLPLLAGAILQLLAPHGVRWLGSPRRWVMSCVAIQGACFFPLAFAAWSGSITLYSVFFLVSCYWGFGMAAGAVWGSWVETLVPKDIRSTYFAKRTRYVQAGTLVGLILGGFSLQYARGAGFALQAFAVLFAAAAGCRLVSAWALSKQSDGPIRNEVQKHVSFLELGRRVWNGGSERFLVYLVAMQFAVYFSGPYFNPYMLRHMQMSYVTYVLLIGSCFLAKMFALPFWGIVAQRKGPQTLLWFGGLGIIPVSGLWLVSNSLPFLFALQIAGGIAWAAYELAMLLLFFESLKRDERTSLMTLYNAGNALAMVIGSICGGLVLKALSQTPMAYLIVFGLSSVLRLLTVGILVTLPKLRLETTPIPESAPVSPSVLATVPVVAVKLASTSALATPIVERRAIPAGIAEDTRVSAPKPQSTLAN